ncbi:MAG: helix-turn-helix transcriptional regulator [Kofleriaceae bacterium]
MRCAPDLDDYVRDSREAYVIDRSFCTFHTGTLFGVVVWGRPAMDEAKRIVHSRTPELTDPGPHELVLDYRLLEVVDLEAFKTLGDWLALHRETLTRVTSKVALIQPTEPFAAATVGGFYSVVKSPYPSQLCTTLEEAEAWLGVPTVETVTDIYEASSAGHSTTTQLVALLERSPGLAVDAAAKALGLTGRTLQRRLQTEGTTFLAEARKATVRRAKHLLATTDDKIADVARAVGCTTAQHFTELFRTETGVPPATWRANKNKPA